MLSFSVTRGRESGYVALRAGQTLLIEHAGCIVDEFEGLLAAPTPYPSAEDCTEVRYSVARDDDMDPLGPDCAPAAVISEEDKHRLAASCARLADKSAQVADAERVAIEAFRLPDPEAERDLYREWIDPETGAKRLVVLWGIARTDAKGALVATGPPAPWILGPGGVMPAAYGAAAARPATCRSWPLGIVLAVLVVALGVAGCWWAGREHGKLADTWNGKLDRLGRRIEGLDDGLKDVADGLRSLRSRTRREFFDLETDRRRIAESTTESLAQIRKNVEADLKAQDERTSGRLEELRTGIQASLKKQEEARDRKLDQLRSGLRDSIKDFDKATNAKLDQVRKDIQARTDLLARATDAKLAELRRELLARIQQLGRTTDEKLAKIHQTLSALAQQDEKFLRDIKTLYGFHATELPRPPRP